MLINGIDISTLGAKLYDRVIKTNRVKTAEDWLDGDIQPTFVRQQDSFKSIMLSFLILGNSEEDAFLRISKLTNLIKKSSLVFDDINLTFDVTMIGYGEPERLKNGNFIVTYQLNGDYAKGEREVYTTNSNLTNSFKLTLVYYKNSTNQIAVEPQLFEQMPLTAQLIHWILLELMQINICPNIITMVLLPIQQVCQLLLII